MQPTFSLTGLVVDPWTDVGLSGVTVEVVAGQSPGSTTTDRDGRYLLTTLAAGGYLLRFSRPPLQTTTANTTVSDNTTLRTNMFVDVPFPLPPNEVTGHWTGGGPYPDLPMYVTLIRDGQAISGWYRDRSSSSDGVTGTSSGRTLVFRVPLAGGTLTFECTVEDERHMHGVVKNERLGGNIPIQLTR